VRNDTLDKGKETDLPGCGSDLSPNQNNVPCWSSYLNANTHPSCHITKHSSTHRVRQVIAHFSILLLGFIFHISSMRLCNGIEVCCCLDQEEVLNMDTCNSASNINTLAKDKYGLVHEPNKSEISVQALKLRGGGVSHRPRNTQQQPNSFPKHRSNAKGKLSSV
jgi:hypothetical protein